MLKESDVKFYFKNGYLILDDKLDVKTLSELKESAKQLIDEYKKNRFSFIKKKKSQKPYYQRTELQLKKSTYRMIKRLYVIKSSWVLTLHI